MRTKIMASVFAVVFIASLNCTPKTGPTQGANSGASNSGSAAHSDPASGSTAQASPTVTTSSAIKSVYTDLNGKVCSAERTTSEVSSERTCPGLEGFKLIVQNDDERDSITIITPDGRKHPLNFFQTISDGHFCSVGNKAEWRVATRNGKDVPIALIARVDVQAGDDNKLTSYLSVSKITEQGICVTDRINPVANANEKARQAADSSANKPCLKGN